MNESETQRSKPRPGSSDPIPHCPVCAGPRQELFQAVLLGKHQVRYFLCRTCGLLQTEEPYWLKEAYGRAIADGDTGLVSRNLDIARRLSSLLYFCFDPQASYLEYAGGYGLLTRLMRDRGFDFYWHDRFCENQFARGFEWDRVAGTRRVAAVTAFEVMEHVSQPAEFIREVLGQGKCRTMIFTTLLYDGEPPRPGEWWYYALESGQHVSFFNRRTLVTLADQLGLRLYTNGWFHVLTDRKIPGLAFKLLSSRLAGGADLYVRRRMRSKTFDDHEEVAGRQS